MKPFRMSRALPVLCAALAACAPALAQNGQSDKLFHDCRAAWADNNIGAADELCYKSLTAPDFKDVPADTMSGVRILFIGDAADNPRVKVALEPSGAEYVFVEAK